MGNHDPLMLCSETLKKSRTDENMSLGPANSSSTSSGFVVEGFSMVFVNMLFICELDIISIRFWVGMSGQSCQCTRTMLNFLRARKRTTDSRKDTESQLDLHMLTLMFTAKSPQLNMNQ